MNSPLPEALRPALELIRAGKLQTAQRLLVPFVQTNPNSEQGWFLLSLTLTDRKQQADCLRRVLQLNPANAEAKTRLAQLVTPAQPRPQPAITPSEPPASASAPSPAQPKVPPFITEPTASSQPFDDLPPPPEWLRPSAIAGQPKPPAAPEPQPLTPTSPVEPPDWAALAAMTNEAGPETAVPAVEPMPRPAPVSSAGTSQPGVRRPPWAMPLLIFLLALTLVCSVVVGVLIVRDYQQAHRVPPTHPAVVAVATVYRVPTLPPTWTISPTPSISPTPTPKPTRTLTPTPTFAPPNATARAQMNDIQQQVSDLRGLPIRAEVPQYVISTTSVRRKLEGLFFSYGSLAQLEDETRVLSALGLIKPTYDLFTNTLNSLTDNLGGFYVPWTKELFVIGNKFSGVEHFIYSHEYDHALVDQNFQVAEMGVYPVCLGDAQRCKAIEALVEGDATLLMFQWWQQYATPRDYEDILNYKPPKQTLPEQFPPPYALLDSDFAYEQGLDFIRYLYDRGNWAEVNRAYANPPQSTEQILHPAKYLAGEEPVFVSAPPLTDTLGAGWRLLTENVLGEWDTYLILGYGADVAAQLDDSTAGDAAAGWGGDRYQVYYDDATGETVMAVHWVWDAKGDATEFRPAMRLYQDERFRGAKVENRTDGECWEVNNQVSCVFSHTQETLWLLAPNQTLLNNLLAQYPGFP